MIENTDKVGRRSSVAVGALVSHSLQVVTKSYPPELLTTQSTWAKTRPDPTPLKEKLCSNAEN